MTTHSKEKIIAAASNAGIQLILDGKFGREDYQSIMGSFPSLARFYAIAFEAGKIAGVREYTTAKLSAQGITCYGGNNEAIRARGDTK